MQDNVSMNEAWSKYRQEIEEVRALALRQPWAADPKVRAQAYYLFHEIEAAAFNLVIGPRPEYPNFYVHAAFEPLLYTYALHAADFVYRRCYLDGRRTYRIWGRRNTSVFVDFQVINVFYGMPGAKKVGNWDLDRFHIESDGSFEIIASSEPHEGNWIRLEPASGEQNYLNTREVFNDWERERGVELHIERVDDGRGPPPVDLDEPQLIERLGRAGRFFRFIIDDWSVQLTNQILKHAGYNAIYTESFATDQAAGNNPSAIYPTAMWKIQPDEALILESEIPNAQYWSVQLGNMWWEVLDFTYHQTSINGHQAVADSDGKFRAVVAHTDPGVPNWLDTVGNHCGVLIFRFYRFDRAVAPVIRKVKLSELKANLPRDTPQVDPGRRAEALVRRRRASRARYGY
jgi:hypothetical protein